jgi:hypothetical protein
LDIVYSKNEIELFKEHANFSESSENIIINLDNFTSLSKIDINVLLNISVLEINLINLPENFQVKKRFIIQLLREKGIVYKNIIEN